MYEPGHVKITEAQKSAFQRCFLKDSSNLMVDHTGRGPVEELHQNRSELRRFSRSLLDTAEKEKRSLTDTEKNAFDACSLLLEDIQHAFDKRSTIRDVERSLMGSAGVTNASTVQFGIDSEGRKIPLLSKEHRMADFFGAKDGNQPNFTAGEYLRSMILGPGNNQELRAALSEGTDSAGGYTVPDIVMAQLIDRMRAASHVITAGAVTIPLTSDKTTIASIETDPTPGWRGENEGIAESEPTFAGVQFLPKSLAVLVKVSRELLEDSVNINTALEIALTQAMAAECDRVCMFGSGSGSEPKGLVNVSGINSHAMGDNGASLTNWSPLLATIQLLADNNAPDPTAAIMAPRTRFALSGLVDTLGQPLRRPDLLEKLPLLQTTKVPVNEEQGTSGAVCSSIITGDFKQLFIGARTALRIEVLKERFADNHQYAFVAHLRMDVALAHAKAFAVLKGIKA